MVLLDRFTIIINSMGYNVIYMPIAHYSPAWFLGYDVTLEVLFAVMTFVVSLFTKKIYEKDKDRASLFISLSFFSISVSYVLQAAINLILLLNIDHIPVLPVKIMPVDLFTILVYVHFTLMIFGLIVFTCMTLKTKKTTLSLLTLITLTIIFLSENTLLTYLILSAIYLAFISKHYITILLKKKRKEPLLDATVWIIMSFILLFSSKAHFLLSVQYEILYVVGHIFEMFAIILIFNNFAWIKRHEVNWKRSPKKSS